MLKFLVYENGQPAEDFALRNCYLLGSDGNAMRCEVSYEDGCILVEKREAGSAALALQYPAGDLGELTLQTCLLPDRDEPYLLRLELARHRLMTLYAKLEDWGMFELDENHPVTKQSTHSQKLFVEALCSQQTDPPHAEALAHDSLIASLDGTEELALAHSDILLRKRKAAGSLPRGVVGCGVGLDPDHVRLRTGLAANFDYLQLPAPWKALAPEEGEYHWDVMDGWAEWAMENRAATMAGPLLAFDTQTLPDWLYIWEHDYDTIRDLAYEHIERIVTRYRNAIAAWNVASGLHVNSHFSFNFEQLMDLSRMGLMLVKKVQPAAKAIIELQQPYGEYYSYNPRSIPPLMYADLIIQSGVEFDGFGIRVPMGQAVAGQYTRDLMQFSNLLDLYGSYGKPLYITLAAPSEPVSAMMIADPNNQDPVDANSGYWRRPWSSVVQSHWLEAAYQIAVSKPYVEGVAWQQLLDHPDIELPLSGLVSETLQPKASFRRLTHFRRSLISTSIPSPSVATSPSDLDDVHPEDEAKPTIRDPDPEMPRN